MIRTWHCCLFLPVTLLTSFCTDTGHSYKFVCIGDSVHVFQNITSSSFSGDITLYKTFADKVEAIATFFSDKDIIHDKYKQKVSLENGTILIRDFQISDEAKYVILYDGLSKRKEVQICATAPPKRCKPNISHDGNFLTVSLDDPDYCGRPVVSVHWMEYTNISYTDDTTIELPPGKEAGTYRACIEGVALNCLKNSTEWDKCTSFTIKTKAGNNDLATSSVTPQMMTNDLPTVVIVSFVLVIVFLILLIVVVILKILQRQFGIVHKKSQRGPNQTQLLLQERHAAVGEQSHEEPVSDTDL